ncbi:NrdR family transcriptional regulator [Anatilimnocola floriformis]|uniref:NrdR family transcriptional regulator n=1 Tax=Anatilimnocola floriformis TaxID=2948575 RepID=UPI0036F39207
MNLKRKNTKVATDRGLKCHQCDSRKFRVVYTRAARGGKLVRRRQCLKCGERLTTWERAIGVQ